MLFVACGDDNKPSSNGGDESVVKQVTRVDDLGGCNKNKFGEIIYVVETDSLYECTGKGWVATDSSAIEGVLSESSSSESDDDDSSDSKSSSSFKTDSTDVADVETVKVDSVTLKGLAQKGPFASGTAVTVYGLDSLLEKTKTKFTGKVAGDSGAFKVENIVLPSQFALVEVSGFFKSEVSGKNTSGTKTTLSAIVDLSEGKSVKANVNLFTTLEYARVKHLVAKDGFNVPAAKKRATTELLAFFGAKGGDLTATSISLDTTAAGEALLTASVMLVSDLSASKFGSRLSDVIDLFAESGIVADEELLVGIADWASKVDSTDNFESIRKNVKEMKLFETVPDFDGYIYKFWTSEYKLGACTDSLEETIKKNDNKKSDNYGMGYACTSKRWHKSTALDTDLGLCTGKMEGSFKEYKGGKSTEYYVCRSGTWNKITETQFELKECTEERDNEYVMTTDSSYFVCSGKQWKELDADGYELRECNKDRDQKIFKTKRENYYKCVSSEWEKSDKLSYEMQDAGACTDKNNLDTFETESLGLYVCDSEEWREATEPENEFGICSKKGVTVDSIYKTSKSNYFVCSDGAWAKSDKDAYEFQQLGACTQAMNLETHETESHKKFVCDNLEWREPTSLEKEIGVCGSPTVPTDSFAISADKRYVCINKKWTETDSISYELKTRCIEANNEKRKKTKSNDYYGCVNRSDNWNWTPITLVVYEYGFCSRSNSNNKVMRKASDNTYWYCNGSWESISDTVYSAGKICNSSTDSTYSNGWTCVHTTSPTKYYWRTATTAEKATELVCRSGNLKKMINGYTCVASGWRTSSAGETTTGIYCDASCLTYDYWTDGKGCKFTPYMGYVCETETESWRKATNLEIEIDSICGDWVENGAYRVNKNKTKVYQCTNKTSHTWKEIEVKWLSNVYAGNYGGSNRYLSYRYATFGDTSLLVEPVKIRHYNDSSTTWTCPSNISEYCDSIGVMYDWAGALALDKAYNSSKPSLSGNHQGACPSGWHVLNTQEAEWKSSKSEALERIGVTLGDKNRSILRSWLSYPANGHVWPYKIKGTSYTDLVDYAWYMNRNFVYKVGTQYDNYTTADWKSDYNYVYCIKN